MPLRPRILVPAIAACMTLASARGAEDAPFTLQQKAPLSSREAARAESDKALSLAQDLILASVKRVLSDPVTSPYCSGLVKPPHGMSDFFPPGVGSYWRKSWQVQKFAVYEKEPDGLSALPGGSRYLTFTDDRGIVLEIFCDFGDRPATVPNRGGLPLIILQDNPRLAAGVILSLAKPNKEVEQRIKDIVYEEAEKLKRTEITP